MLALGLKPGERVGIWSPNNAEWIVTQYATAKAGLILVNINPAYRLSELEYALNKVGCRALVTATRFKTSDYIGMVNTLAPELAPRAAGPSGRRASCRHLRAVIQIGGSGARHDPVRGRRPAWAARRNARAAGRTGGAAAIRRPDQHPVHLGHDRPAQGRDADPSQHPEQRLLPRRGHALHRAGQGLHPGAAVSLFRHGDGHAACLTHGAAMVLPAEGFDPLATLEAMAEERCTSLYGVPTMFIAELDHPDFAKFDLTSLRTGMMAGAPCPIEVMRRCISDMHLTRNHDRLRHDRNQAGHHPDPHRRSAGTAGRDRRAERIPHVEVKIVDADGPASCRAAPPGEFCTRGYSVMLGYWEDRGAHRAGDRQGGWMHTGDLATMDDRRLLQHRRPHQGHGHPRRREHLSARDRGISVPHPAIQEVQVFGVPDPRYGEELCAWIKLRAGETLTEEDVKAFCKDQIAHYKVPRHIRFVDEFPMTVTGKMQKFIMREKMVEELGAKG